jgi:P-type Ca2+ transporter type 2C
METRGGAASRWHALTAEQAIARLDTSPDGLTDVEAGRRLAEYGPNRIEAVAPPSAWRILANQLRSVVVGLLFVAAVLALVLGERLDALAILAVLLINTVIGFAVEWRARLAMSALRDLDVAYATVVRGGRSETIDGRDVVPGDVIVIEAGQAVPADALLLSASELRVVESALTGESAASLKKAGPPCDEVTPVADRQNMIYKSTTVVNGTGRAIVVATGTGTETGRIGRIASSIGDERTPLEVRLDTLGRHLVWLTLAIALLIIGIGLFRGFELFEIVEAGIALAIAAVPEGLPAVATVTLGLGLRRMAQRNALVRRLPAVEALGSATVICTDKTGTLTAGEMAVTHVRLANLDVRIDGQGYGPDAVFSIDGAPVNPAEYADLMLALRTGVLANRSRVERSDAGWVVHGDPTEAALLVAGRRAGIEHAAAVREWPELDSIPFSSERRYMATVHDVGGGRLRTLVKGDPARLIGRCRTVLADGRVRSMDGESRRALEAANEDLARGGLRVLALAMADGVAAGDADADPDLTFLALAGIIDPPVPGVRQVIERFQVAGIRTVMITGDQRATAEAVARELGILHEGETTLDGAELQLLTDAQLTERIGRVAAFSRVSPEDKLRIIESLQRHGEITAMLGDGINDAAALRKASIGVAMGGRGVDIAREAADIVLRDDRFESIGAAVELGRVIYDNIRKFVFYLFSCNLAEVLVLMLAMITGLSLPLLPLQILWLNLVTDTFPALSLSLEPADPDVMTRPPRSPDETLLSRAFLLRIVAYAAIITASSLAAYIIGLRSTAAVARTMCFMTLALSQTFHLGNARSHAAVVAPARAVANHWALGAVAISTALQLITVFVAPLRTVLGTATLDGGEWLVVAVLSLTPAVAGQLVKLLRSARREADHEAHQHA